MAAECWYLYLYNVYITVKFNNRKVLLPASICIHEVLFLFSSLSILNCSKWTMNYRHRVHVCQIPHHFRGFDSIYLYAPRSLVDILNKVHVKLINAG